MLNKGVKKCKGNQKQQAGATKSFDSQEVTLSKILLTP